MRLWKRANGHYYALWEVDGRTRQKALKTSDAAEAEKRFKSFRRDLLAGRVQPISKGINIRLFAFVEEFLQTVAENPDLTKQTERLYTDALEKAKEMWGDIPLPHLTERHLEQYLTRLAADGLKAPTVNKYYRHLKAALRKGRKWYRIKNDLDFPQQIKERRQARFLERSGLLKLMDQIKDQEFYDFCWLSAYSGMRSGEQLRLVPSDVDNPEGFLRIAPERKNAEEIRIPINTHMRTILEKAVETAKGAGRDRLFRFRDQTEVSHRFKEAARAAGLPDSRFHDLRHTFGSHMVMQGVDIRTLQDLMGHKSIQSTLVYAHLSPDHLKEASQKLNYGPVLVKKRD